MGMVSSIHHDMIGTRENVWLFFFQLHRSLIVCERSRSLRNQLTTSNYGSKVYPINVKLSDFIEIPRFNLEDFLKHD